MTDQFQKKARIAYYLTWIPITAIVVLILWFNHLGPFYSILVGIPICAVYSVVCGSSFYLVRAWPLKRIRVLQILVNLLAITLFSGALFAGFGYLASLFIPSNPERILSDQIETLYGVGVVCFALSIFYHYLLSSMK